MKAYRYLTGPDDASFCHRITEVLNRGWQLHGSPTLTYDAETKRVICGQAIVKEVEGKEYSPDLDLSELQARGTRPHLGSFGSPSRARMTGLD